GGGIVGGWAGAGSRPPLLRRHSGTIVAHRTPLVRRQGGAGGQPDQAWARPVFSLCSVPHPGRVGMVIRPLSMSGKTVKSSSRSGTASGSLSMILTFDTEATKFSAWNVERWPL